MPTSKAQWALVTGASSGLGVEFARQLATRGINLVLSARREAPMLALAAELRQQHGVEVVVEVADLGELDAASGLVDRLEARGIALDILINNAGVGVSSPFLKQDPSRLRAMLNLNIVSLTELSQAVGRQMAAKTGGKILLVASMASFQPTPNLAAYGASKAYVLSLGEALNVELAGKVDVTVLCPGLMNTGFAEAADYVVPKGMEASVLSPAKVAQIGLQALDVGKSSVVAGSMNRTMAFATRLFSRHRLAKMVMQLGH